MPSPRVNIRYQRRSLLWVRELLGKDVPRFPSAYSMANRYQHRLVLRGESPAAKNARKTHCDYGHEFTEENTYWRTRNDGRKHRDCLTCMRIYVRPRGAKS